MLFYIFGESVVVVVGGGGAAAAGSWCLLGGARSCARIYARRLGAEGPGASGELSADFLFFFRFSIFAKFLKFKKLGKFWSYDKMVVRGERGRQNGRF